MQVQFWRFDDAGDQVCHALARHHGAFEWRVARRQFVVDFVFVRHPGWAHDRVCQARCFDGVGGAAEWFQVFRQPGVVPLAEFARNFIVDAHRQHENQALDMRGLHGGNDAVGLGFHVVADQIGVDHVMTRHRLTQQCLIQHVAGQHAAVGRDWRRQLGGIAQQQRQGDVFTARQGEDDPLRHLSACTQYHYLFHLLAFVVAWFHTGTYRLSLMKGTHALNWWQIAARD
ncbi:hypothetical protein D3C72_1521450 [compost metagenome]